MVTKKDIRPGKFMYHVHAFNGGYIKGWIEKIVITSYPEPTKYSGDALFAKALKHTSSGHVCEHEFSLDDANIIPNRYNHHRMFFTGKAARRYLNRITKGDLNPGEAIRTKMHWDWDYWWGDDGNS